MMNPLLSPGNHIQLTASPATPFTAEERAKDSLERYQDAGCIV